MNIGEQQVFWWLEEQLDKIKDLASANWFYLPVGIYEKSIKSARKKITLIIKVEND